MLNTNFFNRTQYLRKKFEFFYFTGSDRSGHEQWRHSPLFTLQNSGEQPKRRRREGEEQRGGDGLGDGGSTEGRSLSTIHMQSEQWRAAQTKEKEKGRGKSSATVMDGGNVVEKGEGGGDSEQWRM
jgi:hypothetical protein